MLAEHQVELLVDVRRFPGSRRHPHFSREALAGSLAAARIDYVHEPDLGGRREPRPDSPNTAWRVAAFRGYADYMDTPQFAAALDRLLRRTAESRTAMLCAEAVPWRCHRRLIADAATVRGVEVLHVLGPGRAERHQLDTKARLVPVADGADTTSDGGAAGLLDPAGHRLRLVYDGGGAGAAPGLPFPAPSRP